MTVLSSAFFQSGPTSRPLSMALTSSNGNNVVSNNNTNNDYNIMADLVKVYLADRKLTEQQQQQQQQPRQINGKRYGPLIEELSSAVLGLTNDYERRYKSQLENLRSNWIIDASNPNESFQQVLDNVFIDDCNWGRIVTIFVFASMFLRQCQCQGVASVTPDDVCRWSADYVVGHNVLAWIKRNGDWMGLIRFYKDGEFNLVGTGGSGGGGDDVVKQRRRIGLPPDWEAGESKDIPPKVDTQNKEYKPKGGEKKIFKEKVNFQAENKVHTRENQGYQPGGGNRQIFKEKLEFSKNAKPKVETMSNKDYKPRGGEKKIINERVNFSEKATPRINTRENLDYEPKKNEIKVFHEHLPWLQVESNRPRLHRVSQSEKDKPEESSKHQQQQQQQQQENGGAESPRQQQQQQQQQPGAAMRQRQRDYDQRYRGEAKNSPASTKPRQLENERADQPSGPATEAGKQRK